MGNVRNVLATAVYLMVCDTCLFDVRLLKYIYYVVAKYPSVFHSLVMGIYILVTMGDDFIVSRLQLGETGVWDYH